MRRLFTFGEDRIIDRITEIRDDSIIEISGIEVSSKAFNSKTFVPPLACYHAARNNHKRNLLTIDEQESELEQAERMVMLVSGNNS